MSTTEEPTPVPEEEPAESLFDPATGEQITPEDEEEDAEEEDEDADE